MGRGGEGSSCFQCVERMRLAMRTSQMNFFPSEPPLNSNPLLQPSPFVRSLNGLWAFRLSRSPSEVDPSFRNSDYFEDESWSRIAVPSNWELQGFGTPIYTNIK